MTDIWCKKIDCFYCDWKNKTEPYGLCMNSEITVNEDGKTDCYEKEK